MKIEDIKRRRKELGLTQTELAYETGLSVPLIQLLERGAGNPSLDTIERLGKVLGFTLRLEFKPADWALLVKAGLPLAGIAESPEPLTLLSVVREFHLAWSQAKEERERTALKALLLAFKSHYPSIYSKYFEAQDITVEWADADGRLLKLARIARAKFGNAHWS